MLHPRIPDPLLRAAACVAVLGSLAAPARSLTFDYSFTAGTSVQAQTAFIAAGDLWAATLSDPITVHLTVGTAALGGSILGQALSGQADYTYASVRGAMAADALSANDLLAVASLPAGSIPIWINQTSTANPPTQPYLDINGSANNTTIQMTTANAAALGLSVSRSTLGGLCIALCDGFIQFNSAFNFDYDRSNGITSGQFDFIGIAAHEIGHALGFISGVDVLDSNIGFPEDSYALVSPLDLFRYSADSVANGGAIDFTANNLPKYFSINQGAPTSVLFSNGASVRGDGRQASHWKDGLGLGMMDPTSAGGELLSISPNDRTALDVIGWNLTAVPEPERATLLALGLAVLGIGWRRRQRTEATSP